MTKKVFLMMMSFVMGVSMVSAQTESINNYEGEHTSKCYSVQKMDAKVLTKNVIAKMILKQVMKKMTGDNPAVYNGAYTSRGVAKGNKFRTEISYNNSIVITERDGDLIRTTTCYPHIKKGYVTVTNKADNAQQLEQMRKGEVKKTGETMNILGHECEVVRYKMELVQDTLDTHSLTSMNNDFAVCYDTDLPDADNEIMPGVKGCPLKFINNTVSQISNNMLNLDYRLTVSTEVTSITPRKVDDSELEVPADIKIVDVSKDPAKMLKIITENYEFMKKKGLWPDPTAVQENIYDNLEEEWDF